MMDFDTSITKLIQQRYSCRSYTSIPLFEQDVNLLNAAIDHITRGPRSNPIRIKLIAAAENDSAQLRGLGTYGFIKNPTGFILGAAKQDPGALEDFGYLLEIIILKATELGIGTCWLGGTFTKSRFAKAFGLAPDEKIPSVISLGYPADQQAWIDRTARIYAGSDRRLDWDDIFFDHTFNNPLNKESAGDYQVALENVRLAPSASNKQPWRILHHGSSWHFYIQRTKKYPQPVLNLLLDLADLQKIDIGIAMAHFELTAREQGLTGKWVQSEPDQPSLPPGLEYNISWISET